MWRFSYVAAEGGGAAFVTLYLAFVAFLGIPLMTSEFVIGRLTKESAVHAVARLGGPRWRPLGLLYVVCGVGILSYYAVIAGWTMRYALDATRGAIPGDTVGYFALVGTGWPAVIAFLLFLGITVAIVLAGVKRGLERTAIALMPLLFILLIGLALWSATLGDGGAGYRYYLRPELSELLDPSIIASAAGQAFFSLSLGMGALMTYASYLRSEENLLREGATVAAADFGVAFLSGLVVFPMIFHFGLGETIGLGGRISDNTVGTLFIALPAGLRTLGTLGNVITALFFVMLFFAALTSAISLLEVAVAAAIDGWGWSRPRAAWAFGGIVAACGIPSAVSLAFLDAANKLVGDFLLILGGLLTCLLVGYRVLPEASAELAKGLPNAGARRAWAWFIRYLVPPVLVVVLAFLTPTALASLRRLIGL